MSTHVVFLAADSLETWNLAMRSFYGDEIGDRYTCAKLHPDFFGPAFAKIFPAGASVVVAPCYATSDEETVPEAYLFISKGPDRPCEVRSGRFVSDELAKTGMLHPHDWQSGMSQTFNLF